MCNLDENTKPAWSPICVKYVAQTVQPAPVADGITPQAGLKRKRQALGQAVLTPDPFTEFFITTFTRGSRGEGLTPERLQEPQIGSILRPKDTEALWGMLSKREYTCPGSWEQLQTTTMMVYPYLHGWQESGHNVWSDFISRILLSAIPTEQERMQARVRHAQLKTAWGPYRNALMLVPKKRVKYLCSTSAMCANQFRMEYAAIPPNAEEFPKAVAG